jgi:hypothetical protein
VGTVWFGVAQRGQPTRIVHRKLPGDRERIRVLAAYVALRLVARAVLAKEGTEVTESSVWEGGFPPEAVTLESTSRTLSVPPTNGPGSEEPRQ